MGDEYAQGKNIQAVICLFCVLYSLFECQSICCSSIFYCQWAGEFLWIIWSSFFSLVVRCIVWINEVKQVFSCCNCWLYCCVLCMCVKWSTVHHCIASSSILKTVTSPSKSCVTAVLRRFVSALKVFELYLLSCWYVVYDCSSDIRGTVYRRISEMLTYCTVGSGGH